MTSPNEASRLEEALKRGWIHPKGDVQMLTGDGRNGMKSRKGDGPEQREKIGPLEESVLRMRHGIVGTSQGAATYEKLPVSEAVYQKLLQLELRALQKTGRLDKMLKERL